MHSSGSRISISRNQPSLKKSKSKGRSEKGAFLSVQGEPYTEGSNIEF